jgi:hypothetical protein
LSSIEDAAIRVVTCLQMMGEQQSNPVLEILDPQQPFHEDQKYPENKLIFNNGEWRAYYHRHAPPYRFENSQGQAQKWFVTNRWVTNEAWQDAGRFREFFSKEPEDKSILLVERWLLAMLMLFQEEIQSLLEQREQQVKKLAKQSSFNEVLEDRRFYILAEMDIQLQDKLAYVLTGLG